MDNVNKMNQALSKQKKMINKFNYFQSIKSRNNYKINASEFFNNIKEKSINEKNNSLPEDKIKIKEIDLEKFKFRKRFLLKGLQLKDFIYNKNFNNFNLSNKDNNKSNIIQRKKNLSFLQLSADFKENKNNSLISTKFRIPKKLQFKNSFYNVKNEIPNLKMHKKQKSDLLIFHDIGKNLLGQNKYLTDLMIDKVNENNEKAENESNMEKKEIKIEKLAKDLFLFQNEEHFKNISFKKNNSFSNLLNKSYENNNFINAINKINNINIKVSPISISKMSTRAPSSRIYSGNINNFKSVNNKFNFDKNKIFDILNNKELSLKSKKEKEKEKEYEYYIEGTNILSPFCDKARDSFLYNKIFLYFGQKKSSKVMSKYLNNKLNLIYSEDEDQFNAKIERQNKIKEEKGKGKILRVGKSDTEKRSESMNHKVEFIKKVFDYAFPDIVIYKIRHKSKVDESEIRKKMEKKDNNEKIKIHKIFSKKKTILNSVKIEKI